MDPLTHALSGALLARAAATSPSATLSASRALPLRWQITAGFAAAAFPDIDLILRLIDTITYLNWHQGPTHSLILLPLWAWLLAWLFSKMSRERYAWPAFYQTACLGIAIHIAGDLVTSYGLMLFAPFSTERYSLPLVFVIDPWFSLIIVAGLAVSWYRPQQKISAISALFALCGYVIFLGMLQQQATAVAHQYVRSQTLPPPGQIDIFPQPLSPYHWKIIIRNHETYHIADIDLSASAEKPRTGAWLLPKMIAAYRPSKENNWHIQQLFGNDPTRSALLRQAWLAPAFMPFRGFAQFPVLDSVDTQEPGFCAWFYDLRFKFPELPPSFRYGVCRENDQADWQMVRQRGLFYID